MGRLKNYIFVLTICLLVSLMPFSVNADDTGENTVNAAVEDVGIGNENDNENDTDDYRDEEQEDYPEDNMPEEPEAESSSEHTSECDHTDGMYSTLTKTEAVTAKCTEAGTKEYWTCSICEKVFSDQAGTEITDFEAWKAEHGEGYISPAGHSYSLLDKKESTCDSEGQITYTCENCGDTYTETMPKTAHSIVGGKCANCGCREDVVLKADGNWYYVVGDDIQTDYTGIKANGYGCWRIVNGEVDFGCESVEKNENGWWYIKGGKVQFGYTGIRPNSYGWWRIVNGKVDFNCTSVEQNENGWWYCKDGKVQFDYTGFKSNSYGCWRIVNGKVDFNCTSIEQNENGWWYCKNGKVQFNYTGIKPNRNGWWRIVNGKVDFGCNTVEQNENGWWYCKAGKVQFGFTGVANNRYGWWYCKDGKVQFDYNGLAANRNGNWLITNGRVTFSQNGLVSGGDGNWYYTKDGKVLPVTGFYSNAGGTWYVVGGKVNFYFTGTAKCGSDTRYVVEGKVQAPYGITPDNAQQFFVVFGDSVGEGLGLGGNVHLRHTTLISEALNLKEYNFSRTASGYLYETRGDSLPTYMDVLSNVAKYSMTQSQIDNTKVVIIEGGLNDFLQYTNWYYNDNSGEYLKDSVISFISAVRSTYSNADVYFAYGEGPSKTWADNNTDLIIKYKSAINDVFEAVKETPSVKMIDGNNCDAYYYYNMLNQNNSYYLDGYHPSVSGHRVMADKILKMLTK